MDTDMRKCPVCGEMYSTTYRTCPFCAEDEAIKKGKPIHRNASDFRNRRGGGALGVTILVLVLVLAGAASVFFFGDNIAQMLGMRHAVDPNDNANNSVSDNDQDQTDDDGEPVLDGDDGGQQDGGSDEVTAPDTAVTLDQTSSTITAGKTLQLTAGQGSGTYTFSSSDAAIATVDENGLVTGMSAGKATITVSDGFTTASCDVVVNGSYSPSTGLSINRTDFTQGVGDSFRLRISGTSSAVTWTIDKPSVATIAADGTVTGVSRGTARATATVDGQTLTCIVRIT